MKHTGRRQNIATRTESARNFCLKQPQKVFAFYYGNFEKSKSRGGIHYDCRPCRPKHAGRVLWVNAQTCKKPLAFENGPEARETPEKRSSARTRAKPEGVCTRKFLISVVNNLGQLVEGATTQNFESIAFKDPKTGKNSSKSPFPIETVCSQAFLAEKRLETAKNG